MKLLHIRHITPQHWVSYAMLLSIMTLLCLPAYAAKQSSPSDANVVVKKTIIGSGNVDNCAGEIASPSKLTLPLNKSTLINLPEPLASRTVGNKTVVDVRMVSPKTIYIVGVDIGSTNMIIQGKSGACTIVDVVVTLDPDPLKQDFEALFPLEKNVSIRAANDSLIISGTVEDAITANRMIDIARAYVRRKTKQNKTSADNNTQQKTSNDIDAELGQYDTRVNFRVVNMLSVGAQQQVMLEVKVAEISKTLLDQMGAQGRFGGDKFKLLTPFFATDAAVFAALGIAPFQSVSQLVNRTAPSVTVDGTTFSPVRTVTGATETLTGGSAPIQARGPTIGSTSGKGVSVDAQKKDGLVKILAEPSIMAISGQEGSFLAGGTIFIPVAQQNAANGGTLISLEEKEFGVGVKFTPTVLAGGRINLKVSPEVSELNREGVGISATGFAGQAIFPAFSVRKASTTVQLMDGQSFAIGGLIKNNTTTNISAFPVLGEIPILGALFRSTQFQKEKTELIFVVTPHLVKPLSPEQIRLPTDRYTDPSRSDLFLRGKLEGPAPSDVPPVPKQQPALKPNMPEDNATGFDVR